MNELSKYLQVVTYRDQLALPHTRMPNGRFSGRERLPDPYFISADIVDLIRAGAGSVPWFRLDPSMLPTPEGFALFEKPLAIVPAASNPAMVTLGAIDWEIIWEDMGEPTLAVRGFPEIRQHRPNDEDPDDNWDRWNCLWRMGTDKPHQFKKSEPDLEAERRGYVDEYPDEAPMLQDAATLVAAFIAFLNQPIVDTMHERAPRSYRRRAERMGRDEPALKVIRLRRVSPRIDSGEEPNAIDWSHRWIVRGHWHRYWQGHDTDKSLVPRWIGPYVKGPDDKPLALRDPSLYLVNR